MLRYIMMRLLAMAGTLLVIITLTFLLMHAIPGGPYTSDVQVAPEIEAALKRQYNLDQPLWAQYLAYLKGVLRFDFGPSFKYPGITVNDLIREGLPVTFRTGALALMCVIFVGVPMGIVAALNRGRWPDTLVMAVATLGVAIPSFVVATLLIYIVALKMGLVPIFGLDDWRGYILPVIALSGFWLSFLARLTRSSLIDVLGQDYMLTARAKGLHGRTIIVKHGLRNALIPVITILGPVAAHLLTGSFVIEQIFALPGIGRHFVLSISNRDYTAIMGITIFYAAALMLLTLLVDILYGLIDPRISLAGERA